MAINFKKVIRKHIRSLYYKLRRIDSSTRFIRFQYTRNRPKATNKEKIVIFTCNGITTHAGLTDRLVGCISVYQFCRKRNIQFRINFTSPFRLEDYLLPNQYDWRIQETDVSYNRKDAVPLVSYNWYKYPQELGKIDKLKAKQVHVYTNWNKYVDLDSFSNDFHHLFVPAPDLQQSINYHIDKIGCKYIGLTFRFQHHLGDFKEYTHTSNLSSSEKAELLKKSITQIHVFKEKYPEYQKILITSDSITFLNEAKQIPFVYIIPENIAHCDNADSENNYNLYKKSFLDMFLLSKADKVFCPRTGVMYKSNFPFVSALINNVPFEWYEFR